MPRSKVGGAVSAAPPIAIRILESKTIAHGSGLLSFKDKSVVSDPWIISAALASGIAHERLE